MHAEFIALVSKDPDVRPEFECDAMVPWFRDHCALFTDLPEEIVADVIRHCGFERKRKDDVLIKQGEIGDRLYITLKGQVSIYVIQEQKDSPAEIYQQVNAVCSKKDLEREFLGQYVWSGGEGKSFGEMALLKVDCIRTATVVADMDTDLVVIDRNLYNRSVRDVLEKEFEQKVNFVEKNVLFHGWPVKQQKLLTVALKKETAKFGSYIIRQGAPTEHMFFLLSGEIEITCDQSLFRSQYEDIWREMEALLPGLLPRSSGHCESPHEMMRRKKSQHKIIQMCLLGGNEIVGATSVVLGLPNSLDNAMITRESEILVLSKNNYDRLFNKKFAQKTLANLRERLTMRIYLYIHRCDTLHQAIGTPFLKYLIFLLQDDNAVEELRRTKRRELEEKRGLRTQTYEETEKYDSKEALQMANMLKLLNINPKDRGQGRLPSVESSQRVINEIEEGLRSWVERSRGDSSNLETRFEVQPRPRLMTFHGPGQLKTTSVSQDFLKPDLKNAMSMRRSRTPTD
ncbi:uncharacterized protein LOC127834962 isoform X3 [Dreissena polymorpha]|uniref:uncharacterized protein LOC127834962 isoform X3 n=1 Tax=Dreissena polymorpha TaxID=45954 RepID=UPI0022645DF0|nr:uncharacterized protein LOC127834962 isoform X3 [Dreissena polymorpha]